MVKRIFLIFMSALLIALLAVSTVGCGCGPEEAEAKALVLDLVNRSQELNRIYYGKGLSYKDSGNPNDIYMEVSESEKYCLKSRLLADTRKVFSDTYATSIINMAFNGVASEINQNSVQARYMVRGDDDWLYVNKSYKPLVNTLPEYDFDTIVITKTSSRFIEATIEAVVDVKKETKDGIVIERKKDVIEVTLILEGNVWRLDSATC